ncbi:phage portal protein, HK97 family [Micrococcales bacterium KH10]|nr:phage portal protein, HK97 family [Micrococcales bacterium KH10]
MGIANWFRRAETTPPTGVTPPPRSGVSVLTADRAMGLSAVYRAVSIWATATSQLTLDVWRGGERIDTPAVVRQPDLMQSLSAFLEETTTSLAALGNAYWWLHKDDRNVVRTITVLDPLLCEPVEADGTLRYRDKVLKPGEFHHLKLLRVPGHIKGLGPIQAARAELNGALDLQDYASGWFQRGDVPPGLLSSDQHLNGEQAEAYKQRWYEDREGVKVLGSGLDFKPLLLSPEDAQWLEAQKFSVTQIARLFGVPAHLLLAAVDGSNLTYSNIQQADTAFIRWTLAKPLREIEEAFTSVLPRGQVARFNIDAFLRPDTATRYSAHKTAIEAGFMTVEEVREIEGLPNL